MNRYSPTERLGVNETEKIVMKNLGWIFREQPIIDVGIDAIIELVIENEPSGKFIAVQIKSGLSNFHKTEKYLSHYVTNIHYNYWLNLCIPIIIIAHLPDEGKTYWQEIKEKNFTKTKKRWKIEIPLLQEFNEKSEKRLALIASSKDDQKFDIYRGRIDSNEMGEIFDDLNSITDATFCVNNITSIIKIQTQYVRNVNEQLEIPKDKSEISVLYKNLSKKMNLTSKRIETEVELFSQVYSVGISAFEKMLINLEVLNLKYEDFTKETDSLKKVPIQMNDAIEEYRNLKNIIYNIPTSGFTFFKEAKKQQIDVLNLLILELQDASDITKKIFEKL